MLPPTMPRSRPSARRAPAARPRPNVATETLEGRTLFAVTVTEAFTGYYVVEGSSGDDVIDASVSMAEETFTLDGVTYDRVGHIAVYAGGGNDTISLVSSDGYGWIGATIDGGQGHDIITLNFDGGVWGGGGHDTIHLSDSFRGEARGGEGSDFIVVSGETVDPEILGGAGNDVIDASGNHYGTVILGGAGNDMIYGSPHDDEIYAGDGNDTLSGNGGNDIFYTRGGGTDYVYGGDGSDDWLYADATDAVLDLAVEVVYYE